MPTIVLSFWHPKGLTNSVIFSYPERNLGATISERRRVKADIAKTMMLSRGRGYYVQVINGLMTYNYIFQISSNWENFKRFIRPNLFDLPPGAGDEIERNSLSAIQDIEVVMVTIVCDQSKDALWIPDPGAEGNTSNLPVIQRKILKNFRQFSKKFRSAREIYKGFYLKDEATLPETERPKIREMHNQLKLWVQDLFEATLQLEETEKPELLRLIAFHTERGIPLFTHDWEAKNEFADQDLFSSLLSGINTILQKSLHRGQMEEIHLSQATLLVAKTEKFPVAFVLVTTKVIPTLRDALRAFAQQFNADFSQYYAAPEDTAAFLPAISLVDQCFPT